MIKQLYTPEELKGILRQAHYHLGRVLYEGELDFDRAVSELECAVSLDPDNTRAYYYLGQAIRAQVERKKLRCAGGVPP